MTLSSIASSYARSIYSITQTPQYQAYAQVFNLLYYACLSVYAIINLSFLLHTLLMLSPMLSTALGTLCVCFVMSNELINMKIISNPSSSPSHSDANHRNGRAFLLACFALPFSCLDSILLNTNMLKIQINTLARGGVVLPEFFVLWYRHLLVASSALSFAMNATTNWLCFLLGDPAKKPSLRKPRHDDPSRHRSSWSRLDTILYRLIHHPVTLWSGIGLGGFLYAYGDYQQFTGLLWMISSNGLFLPSAFITTSGCAIAMITFIDRVLIWGDNYRQFSASSPFKPATKPYACIPHDQRLRSMFSHLRLAFSTMRGMLSNMLSFTGNYRIVTVLTCSGSAATAYVQNSFQIASKSVDHSSQPHSRNPRSCDSGKHHRMT